MPPFLLPAEPVGSLDAYEAAGGGRALTRARSIGADAVVEEIQRSGLRGRGGAGFPTGTKWASVRRGGGRHHYAVCNAAEGEPATFKDRALMRANPYAVLEGLLVAGFAVDAIEVLAATKASFRPERTALERAAEEMIEAGWVDIPIRIVSGPEEYLFGEEKALLEVIEGNDPLPRWLPPYMHGLYATAPQIGWQAHDPEAGHAGQHQSNPTLVNNVETLANIPHVLARGADWFRTMGSAASPGTACCTVVGDVLRAGVVEVELGTPLRAVLEACGAGEQAPVRAVLSGVSNAVLTAAQLDTPLTYEDFEAAGSGLGAAGFMVYDATACMVEVAAAHARFLWVESCGQCLPCKLGTGDITRALDNLVVGGSEADTELINERLRVVTDGNRCYLPVEAQHLIASLLLAFPEDFAAHIDTGGCPRPRRQLVPKIVDIVDGLVTYDERQARKQPDWSYAE